MSRAHAVLLSVIALALCLIAFELVRIDRELAPAAALTGGFVRALTSPPETRQQRIDRIKRENRELDEEFDAQLAALKSSAKKSPAK